MESAVVIDNLDVVLGGQFTALQNISAVLPAGKIIGFTGPSGAGKTVLIRCLVGRQKITDGIISVLGLPAGSAQLRKRISYMTQGLSVYGDLSVKENLDYFATMVGVGKSEVEAVLKQVDLGKQAGQLVGTLSGGQKQRVSLAVALLGKPELMFLDEPTVGLDPVLREQLWDLFNRLAKGGTTIILTSHVMEEASRCDDLLLIRDGRLLAHGSPTELCTRTHTKTVEESFIKLVGAAK